MMIQTLLVFLLALPLAGDGVTFEFSRTESIDVVAINAAGEGISGVTLVLCPFDGGHLETSATSRTCTVRLTDGSGRASFDAVDPGEHSVTGHLEGFASTTLFPLSIGGPDPIAPDRVFLLLNDVCYHC